jgi:hypothetical protein
MDSLGEVGARYRSGLLCLYVDFLTRAPDWFVLKGDGVLYGIPGLGQKNANFL